MSLSKRTSTLQWSPEALQWFHALIVVQSVELITRSGNSTVTMCHITTSLLSFEGDTHKLLSKQPSFLVIKQTPRIHVGMKTGKFRLGREWRCFDHLSRYQRHFICGMCKNLFKNTIKWSEATTSGRRCCSLENVCWQLWAVQTPSRDATLKQIVHVSSISAKYKLFRLDNCYFRYQKVCRLTSTTYFSDVSELWVIEIIQKLSLT